MKTVVVEMYNVKGKLVRTFRESFYGIVAETFGTLPQQREQLKAIALANVVKRLRPLYPTNTFKVRNSNM